MSRAWRKNLFRHVKGLIADLYIVNFVKVNDNIVHIFIHILVYGSVPHDNIDYRGSGRSVIAVCSLKLYTEKGNGYIINREDSSSTVIPQSNRGAKVCGISL